MRLNKPQSIILLIIFFFSSCIEEYDPGDIYDHDASLSVSGWITDVPGRQVVSLYLSTPINISIPHALTGGHVEVEDDQGNVFIYNEVSRGDYAHIYNEGDIQTGRSYKLRIITPEGTIYESEFEPVLPAPPIENINYEKTFVDTREIGVELPGLKFYTDFNAEGDYAEFFKLDVYETYEFHTMFTEVYWLRRGVLALLPQDSIRRICYRTEKVSDIKLITTRSLAEKKIPDFPLHFVDNQSQRLQNGYSPELRLLSLTETAHQYWENQKRILEESGGLFESQPPATVGNIYNIEDPDEKVLGFFGASSVSKTRIYIPKGIINEFDIEPYCIPAPVSGYTLQQLYRNWQKTTYMIYYPDQNGALTLHIVKKDCYDCTAYPLSTTEKPEYWED
jgi:hypothetical protein